MTRAHSNFLAPANLVVLVAAGQLLMWSLAPALSHSAPPRDVVENYMWGREWVIATFKHPALVGWVLEATRLLTGTVGWPAYVVSQLFVAITFIFVFLLGRDLMGSERAAAGTLLLTSVAYYAWPTPEFNQDVAQLPFLAGLPWALWRAVERRSIPWWLLVALLAAGAFYVKLSAALLFIVAIGWIVIDARARKSFFSPGPWIALAIFALLITPLLHWLVVHDFAPLRYAAVRATRLPGNGNHMFLLNVLLNLSGVPVMLAGARLVGPLSNSDQRISLVSEPQLFTRELLFLLIFTVGQLVTTIVGALLLGSSLRPTWGSSLVILIGLLAIALTSRRFNNETLRRIAVLTVLLLVVLPLGYMLVVRFGPLLLKAPLLVNWPQAEIAQRMMQIWERETQRPLRIVSGDDWVAGLVGLTAKDQPSILTNGNTANSPWISPTRLEAEGMLIVWSTQTKHMPELLQPLIASHPIGEERFAWKYSSNAPALVIRYVIIPPKHSSNQ